MPATSWKTTVHIRRESSSQQVIDEYFSSSDADRLKPENALMFTNYTYRYSNPRLKFMCDNVNAFDESLRERM